MSTLATITLGVLADKSGTDIDTIRAYQAHGLLPRPRRVGTDLLLYRKDDVARVVFIRRALALGFSPDTIRELLSLAEKKSAKCGDVQAIAQRHLQEVRRKLADLLRMERELAPLLETCRPEASAMECPILQALVSSDKDRAAGASSAPP